MTLATPFEILFAIDLRGGRVVRLQQGDFSRETAYSDDPVALADGFARAGARVIHLVDLDAARTGIPANAAVIAAIVAAIGTTVAVEVAGGLRDAASVAAILTAGASRAVIGTAALADTSFAASLIATHGPDRIAIAIDVRDGLAVGHGWAPGTPGTDAVEAIRILANVGVTTFEVTAIARDGQLGGPELELYERLVTTDRGQIIASGGITTADDIRALRRLGCAGAIVGRALYEGRLDIGTALIAASGQAATGPFIQREVSAALRERSTDRLARAFVRHVAVELSRSHWDQRDEMLSLAVFFDCARRLDADPAALFGPLVPPTPVWLRETFDAFAARTPGSVTAFGWSLLETSDGPEYRFAWPRWTPQRP